MQVVTATPPTLDQSAPVQQPTINPNVIVATPGSNGFATLNQPSAPATTTGGTGGTGGNYTPAPPPNPNIAIDTAAINNTQKSVDQLPAILAAALAANGTQYQNAESALDAQQTAQQTAHDQGTTTNQQNYDSNLMAALRTGASGLSGLLSILRGTGMEGWANNTVRDATNGDIQSGLVTRDQNQSGLDTSLGNFLTDLSGKRNLNAQTRDNNAAAANKDNATQMQDLYTKMAGYYKDEGDDANATKYLNMAGDQSPQIAKYGVAPVSAYDTTPVAVTSPKENAYAAPTAESVNYSPGSSNGVFTIGDTRKRLAGV